MQYNIQYYINQGRAEAPTAGGGVRNEARKWHRSQFRYP